MTILTLLIPLSFCLLGIAGWAFVWAVNRGQFQDLDLQATQLFDEDDGSQDS